MISRHWSLDNLKSRLYIITSTILSEVKPMRYNEDPKTIKQIFQEQIQKRTMLAVKTFDFQFSDKWI